MNRRENIAWAAKTIAGGPTPCEPNVVAYDRAAAIVNTLQDFFGGKEISFPVLRFVAVMNACGHNLAVTMPRLEHLRENPDRGTIAEFAALYGAALALAGYSPTRASLLLETTVTSVLSLTWRKPEPPTS